MSIGIEAWGSERYHCGCNSISLMIRHYHLSNKNQADSGNDALRSFSQNFIVDKPSNPRLRHVELILSSQEIVSPSYKFFTESRVLLDESSIGLMYDCKVVL